MQVMNGEGLQEILIRAARSESVEASVPEGFEERVMRAIRTVRTDDPLETWAVGLGRAALSSASFAALVGVAALVLVFTEERTTGRPGFGWGRTEAWNGGGDEIAQSWIDDTLINDFESGDPR